RSGHFARLRLLDPQRYHDLDGYMAESDSYQALSKVADRLLDGEPLGDDQRAALAEAFRDDDALTALLADSTKPANARELLAALIDRHGTGRAMFRNNRAGVGGFPQRAPVWHLLEAEDIDEATKQSLLAEFHADIQQPAASVEVDYSADPRVDALIALLDAHPQDKFLLICRSQAKVLALEEVLRTRSGVGL